MAYDPVEQRLRFLKQAAHALAVTSPTVSATLGAAHGRLVTADDGDIEAPTKEWDASRREACGGCGGVLAPGWSCEVRCQSSAVRKGNHNATSPHGARKHMVYSCLRCEGRTIYSLPSRMPKHMGAKAGTRNVEAPQASGAKEAIGEDSSVVKSVNTISKQRKKARKGGLQAMLEKSKTPISSGLDLMDFMQ